MKTTITLVINIPGCVDIRQHEILDALQEGLRSKVSKLHTMTLPAEHQAHHIKYRNLPEEVRFEISRSRKNILRDTTVEVIHEPT